MIYLTKKLNPALDGDETTKDSFIHIQVIVIKMFDYIADFLGKERIYPSKKRRKHSVVSEIECRGYHEDEFRVDADSFLYSGLLLAHVNCVQKAQCDLHVDVHTDLREIEGDNANVCFNQFVAIIYLNRSRPVTGRCSLNQFMKACNRNVLDKYDAKMGLLGEMHCTYKNRYKK